ncbi:Gfo/Idh/MocA family protein [Haloarcula salina]|uniref:Gfo/Idh/MocA family protein n=1 Tax=Haloarcula salina TaxID=1429914 RepID=UPI003C6F032D
MRVGMIGAGSIAQIMHLPYLAELPGVEIEALADPGENTSETLGDRYNVPNRYQDSEALIDEQRENLDAVVIATPMQTHADLAIAALEAGLHTFVEKPIAVTPEDAERVVETAESADAECMVGYMKRYDPGFQRFAELVDDLDQIDLATSVVIPPDVGAVLEDTYDLVQADLDDAFIEESMAARQRQCAEAIGTDDETLGRAYGYHLESICHDVNALRGVFGSVTGIDHVDVFNGWKYLTAQLRYEGDLRCMLESGATDRLWYDERIQVDAPDRSVSIGFSNAFIKNTPADVRVKQGTEETTETIHTPSYDEAFKRELEHFARCVEGDATPRTTPTDAQRDVELIADLFREFEGNALVGDART